MESAPAASTPAAGHPSGYAERVALDYVKSHGDDAALDDSLAKAGVGPGKKHDEIAALVKAMRSLIDGGVTADSEAFWGYLGDAAAAPASAGQGGAKPAAPAAQTAPALHATLNLSESDWTSYARVKLARELAGESDSPTTPKTGSGQSGGGSAPPAGDGTKTGTTPQAAGDPAPTDTRTAAEKYLRSLFDDAMAEQQPITDYPSFFHTGLRMHAPFTVTPAGAIDSGQTKTGGFLEFVHTNIWAWRPARVCETKTDVLNALGYPVAKPWKDETLWARHQGEKKVRPNPCPQYFDPWALLDFSNGWDASSRLSFEFGASDTASASTITGSGDFDAEVNVDKQIFRGWTPDTAYSIDFGGSIGAVTDRSSLRVHPRYLVGPSMMVAFEDPLREGQSTQRRGLFNVHVGRAVIDSVRFIDREKNLIETVSPGVPRYVKRYTNAIEMELYYPLGLQSFVTAGARVYSGSTELSPWTLYVGITTPFTKVAESLFPK